MQTSVIIFLYFLGLIQSSFRFTEFSPQLKYIAFSQDPFIISKEELHSSPQVLFIDAQGNLTRADLFPSFQENSFNYHLNFIIDMDLGQAGELVLVSEPGITLAELQSNTSAVLDYLRYSVQGVPGSFLEPFVSVPNEQNITLWNSGEIISGQIIFPEHVFAIDERDYPNVTTVVRFSQLFFPRVSRPDFPTESDSEASDTSNIDSCPSITQFGTPIDFSQSQVYHFETTSRFPVFGDVSLHTTRFTLSSNGILAAGFQSEEFMNSLASFDTCQRGPGASSLAIALSAQPLNLMSGGAVYVYEFTNTWEPSLVIQFDRVPLASDLNQTASFSASLFHPAPIYDSVAREFIFIFCLREGPAGLIGIDSLDPSSTYTFPCSNIQTPATYTICTSCNSNDRNVIPFDVDVFLLVFLPPVLFCICAICLISVCSVYYLGKTKTRTVHDI